MVEKTFLAWKVEMLMLPKLQKEELVEKRTLRERIEMQPLRQFQTHQLFINKIWKSGTKSFKSIYMNVKPSRKGTWDSPRLPAWRETQTSKVERTKMFLQQLGLKEDQLEQLIKNHHSSAKFWKEECQDRVILPQESLISIMLVTHQNFNTWYKREKTLVSQMSLNLTLKWSSEHIKT